MDKNDLIIPSDEIFSTSCRLTIMILLYNHRRINFTELQKLLKLTPGNMDHHVKKLENAGYIRTYKKLFLKRPLTMIEITKTGKKAFKDYIKKFQYVLDSLKL
jgi:DNA-binding MarR family transcriptional regulator